MKIGITGHTDGIGKAIYDLLSQTYLVYGFSRSNGFNLSNYQNIIDQAIDYDIFINNTYLDNYQELLLNSLYQRWKSDNKIIITIGSTVTEYPPIDKSIDKTTWEYYLNKKSLEKSVRELSWGSPGCRLVLLSPGPTDTKMIAHHTVGKLPPQVVAETVSYVINNTAIKEIVVYM